MIGQLLKIGTTIGGQKILAKLSPMDRTFSNTPKKIQRSSVLSKGRTVSDYIATTHDVSVDFKKLGFNRWVLPECQELLSAPLDGSAVNLVDWTLGSLSVPDNTSYFVQGMFDDDLALNVIGQTTNLLVNSGFELNTSYQTVFHDDFDRVGFGTGAVGHVTFLGNAYSVLTTPQFTNGTPGLQLLNAFWAVPSNSSTIPVSQGTVEFWFAPVSWNSNDTSARTLFSTTGIAADSYVADRLDISVQGGTITAHLWADGPPFVASAGTVSTSFNANEWVHVIVEYTSYGIVGIGAKGLVGTCTSFSQFNGSYHPIITLGTSFGLGGNISSLPHSYSYDVYKMPFSLGTVPMVSVGLGQNPNTAQVAQSTFSNLRITYGLTQDLSVSGGSYAVPTNELDTVDVRSFPVVFKNDAAWNQALRSPGMGWLETPLTPAGTRPTTHVSTNGNSELFLTSSTTSYTITGGSPYWQDASYTAKFGGTGSVGGGPIATGLSVHNSAAGKVTLWVSSYAASFVSTYIEDGPDASYYWQPNRARDWNMESTDIHAWDLGGFLNLNTNGLAVTKDVVYIHSGTRALHVNRTTSANTGSAQQTVAGNASYHINGWYYGISGNVAANVQIDDAGTVVSFITSAVYGQWTSFGGIITPVTGNYTFTLVLDCPGSGEAWFDDIEIRRISADVGFPGNYFPDGFINNASYVTVGVPWTKTNLSTTVSYLPTAPTPPGNYIVLFTNPLGSPNSFFQKVYTMIPGNLITTITPTLSLGPHPVTGTIQAFPSGNVVSFSSTTPDANGNLTTPALSYLASDSYLTMTFVVPANNSFAAQDIWMSYATDTGLAFTAAVVSNGPSYTAILSSGVQPYSWTWVATDQHQGNIALEGVGQWACDYVDVAQQLNSWIVSLPVNSFESITTKSGLFGSAVAVTPISPYHGRYALAITNLASGLSTTISQTVNNLVSFELLSLAFKSTDLNSYEQALSNEVASVGGLSLTAAPDWTVVMVPPLYTVSPIGTVTLVGSSIGTNWFDRLQLESAGFVTPYFDTLDAPATRPPVLLSFNASYLNPTSGTMMAWVNPVSYDTPFSPNGTIFSVYKNAASFVTMGWADQNSTLDLWNPDGQIISVPFPYTPGVWQHIAVTWDSSGTCLYQNGALVAQTSTVWKVPASGQINIGYDPTDSTSYIKWSNANFEKFYVMNRSLSPTEVQRVVSNAEIEGLTVLEIEGLAALETGTYQFTWNDLRGNTTSYDVLLNDFGITNISGQRRYADVSLKMSQK